MVRSAARPRVSNHEAPAYRVADAGYGPTGKSAENPVQSHLQKYSAFAVGQIKSITPAILSHQEGRFAIVTNVGQDAMDADAPLTNGA
jgi:hypothetical protein